MKSIQEKYAYLQQTSWKDMVNTTLGHVSAEKFNEIEAAYDTQIASEQSAEAASEIKSPDDLIEEALIAQNPPSESPESADMGITSDNAGKDQANDSIEQADSVVDATEVGE